MQLVRYFSSVIFLMSVNMSAIAYNGSLNYERISRDTLSVDESDSIDNESFAVQLADTIDLDALNPIVDSLISVWYGNKEPEIVNDFVPDSVAAADTLIVGIPDSVFVERIQALASPMGMTYNEQVKRFIELYVVKRRALVQKMLGQSKYYFPIFEEALDAYGLPLELKFLPIIESALNPNARSRVGAAGLWQFMYSTGKRYGLQVNSYVDDRCDPRKASWAAARFLRDLYSIYHDWLLAIAAYNCGPGNVNRAIARSGGHRDFWKIYYRLPRETRGYVPAFIAAAYAMTYANEHQLYPTASRKPVMPDTVMVVKPLHIDQVSARLNIPADFIRELNPQYRHGVIPAQGKTSYSLTLPAELTVAFAVREDSIYAYQRSKYFPDNKMVPVSEANYGHDAPPGSVKLIYRVKADDVPGSIATRFGVRLADLKYWNNIRRNIIRVDQKLIIYVPKSKVDKYRNIATVVK